MSTEQKERVFQSEYHFKSFDAVPWEGLVDESGDWLVGIRGKSGACGIGEDGIPFGVDLIEMQRGASFSLHTHAGDHILYAISGEGYVVIDSLTFRFSEGNTFFIPANRPHAVGVSEERLKRFLFIAIGHPHKHVSARDRMQLVSPE